MYSPKIQKLIDLFSLFPGVGPKTATRFVFYLAKKSSRKNQELAQAILDLNKSLKSCSFCFKLFEPKEKETLCSICCQPARRQDVLCVVEKETDLNSIEETNLYKGLYFILGGTLPSLKKQPSSIRLKELKERLARPEKFGFRAFKEIILALNPTPRGEATSIYLQTELKKLALKITRLARGLPTGGELEYADRETILSAFKNRK